MNLPDILQFIGVTNDNWYDQTQWQISAEIFQPVTGNTKKGFPIMPFFLPSVQYVKMLSPQYTFPQSEGNKEGASGREESKN